MTIHKCGFMYFVLVSWLSWSCPWWEHESEITDIELQKNLQKTYTCKPLSKVFDCIVFDCIGGVRLVPKDIVLLVCLPEAGSASAQASQRHTFAEYEVCIILARVALETQFYAHCLSFSFSLLHSHCHSHCLWFCPFTLIACHDWVIDSVLASLFVLISALWNCLLMYNNRQHIKEKEDPTAQPSACHKIPIQIKTEGGKISLQSVTSPGWIADARCWVQCTNFNPRCPCCCIGRVLEEGTILIASQLSKK